jgi:hypothetical protein
MTLPHPIHKAKILLSKSRMKKHDASFWHHWWVRGTYCNVVLLRGNQSFKFEPDHSHQQLLLLLLCELQIMYFRDFHEGTTLKRSNGRGDVSTISVA